MRETNFITATDGITKVDLSCLTGSEKTVIFPLDEWINRLQLFMVHLDNVNNMPDEEMRKVVAFILEGFIEEYIAHRRAWVYGHDVGYYIHVNQMYRKFLACAPEFPIEVVSYSSNKKRSKDKNPLVKHKEQVPFRDAFIDELSKFDDFIAGDVEQACQSGNEILKRHVANFCKELNEVLSPNYYMEYHVGIGSIRSNKSTRSIAIINFLGDHRILEWTRQHEQADVDKAE